MNWPIPRLMIKQGYIKNKKIFLEHEGQIMRLRSKRSILKLLGNSAELKKYLQDKGFTIKYTTTAQLIEVMRFYETL